MDDTLDEIATPNDGGPAFPVVYDHGECISESPGMSIRDWFAGQALAAMRTTEGLEQRAAIIAYAHADAMLAERTKQK